jgi:hypothetical protein
MQTQTLIRTAFSANTPAIRHTGLPLGAISHNDDGKDDFKLQPKFGDLIVTTDPEHADFKERRTLITEALAGVKGLVAKLWTAKQFHNHGVFDAVYVEGQDHDGIKAALAPLRKTGLVKDFFGN